jgi:selenocysteine-specific elongation factor
MPREELKSKLGLTAGAFPPVLADLIKTGVLAERGGAIGLPEHKFEVAAAEGGPARNLLDLLGAQPFSPPSLPEAMRQAGAGPEVVRALARSGDLVRLSPDIAFTKEAYQGALAMVKEIVAAEGGVTVARLRDAMAASRRPVLALLEHLDAEKLTRREGDVRTLR